MASRHPKLGVESSRHIWLTEGKPHRFIRPNTPRTRLCPATNSTPAATNPHTCACLLATCLHTRKPHVLARSSALYRLVLAPGFKNSAAGFAISSLFYLFQFTAVVWCGRGDVAFIVSGTCVSHCTSSRIFVTVMQIINVGYI
jgi:hypothetical protein